MILTDNKFYTNPNWHTALNIKDFIPGPGWVGLFDQNGYKLTSLELLYAKANKQEPVKHRQEDTLKKDWFTQEERSTGAVLNHAALFERKGYEGVALEELERWAKQNNLLYKLCRYRSKWGVDFSVDYVDADGNVMEIFHFEYDSYYLAEIEAIREKVEQVVLNIDWEDAAKVLLKRKSEWHSLDFFGQSDWKCAFFGLPKENFKMLAWE